MASDSEHLSPADEILSWWLGIAERFKRPTLVAAHLSLYELAGVIRSVHSELERALEHIDEDLAGINWETDLVSARMKLLEAVARVRIAEKLISESANGIVEVFPT